MKYSLINILYIAIASVLCVSCDKPEDYVPEASFIKIYNDEFFESSYIPLDVVQAMDK